MHTAASLGTKLGMASKFENTENTKIHNGQKIGHVQMSCTKMKAHDMWHKLNCTHICVKILSHWGIVANQFTVNVRLSNARRQKIATIQNCADLVGTCVANAVLWASWTGGWTDTFAAEYELWQGATRNDAVTELILIIESKSRMIYAAFTICLLKDFVCLFLSFFVG